MNRCGVFVDSGYLLHEAGALCLGTKRRQEIACDYSGIVDALVDFAQGHSQLPMLRAYWYDGAPNQVPLPWHLTLFELRYVKLRLGRLVGERDRAEQKGVDSLMVRDLIVLARERAIATAYVLAGDDDLREGVAAAQDQGLQVVLLGIPPTWERFNQAPTLIREADEHIVFQADFFQPYFSRAEAPEVLLDEETVIGLKDPPEIGRAFAFAWAGRATADEIDKLLDQSPVIPRELDVQLIIEAERSLGSLRERDDVKRQLRAGFWAAIREQAEDSLRSD